MGPHSFECGIRAHPACLEDRQLDASMGPHSFECGIDTRAKALRACALCFNGAALIRVRNINTTDRRTLVSRSASMGPHSFECGISREAARRHLRVVAGFNGAALIRVRNTACT